MKILITGVAGLLGSNFAKYLLDKKYKVVGIDDLSGGYKDFVDDRVKFYQFNLLQVDKLDALFKKEKIDIVYHFAAYAAEGLSPFIRNYNYTNNLICSVNIINACIKYNVKKIIFTSSMAVYGKGSPPFKEDQIPYPEDPYGIAKYAVEQDIALAYKQFGLNYTIVRPHNVVGINQNIWDRYRNVIGIWIRQAINKQPLTVFGDGEHTRSFSNIRYYMDPFEKLMSEGDLEIINIGADKVYKIIEVARIVQNIANSYGYSVGIKHLEPRIEVEHAYCNHDKAKEILNFKDHTDIEKLINDMFIWAIEQPNRKVKTLNYEINKNIYSFWK